MIKTRFAPSPTGEVHIGGARTALFAYLFAKSQGGEFLLRIEDTDQARSVEGADKRIVESLKWLSIMPDNLDKIMYQSTRLEVYKKHAFDLVKAGKAYICTCSKERLTELREKQEKTGQPPRYDSKCRTEKCGIENSTDFFKEMMENGYVVRMKMPRGRKIEFTDMIRGEVEFDADLIDDQVIIKSDGFPTYHFAHVIDDHETNITHVFRAEEWLSSTPKHIVLWEMFGWKAPEYAHLSMILPPDKKGKLSKRHGAVAVMDFGKAGYLPEALVNFISFLGWNPKTEKEIYSMEELIADFKIENVNKAPAIFNREKLDSVNEYYLREEIGQKPARIKRLLAELEVKEVTAGELNLLGRGGYKTLVEMVETLKNIRVLPDYEAGILVFKKSTKDASRKGLETALAEFELIEEKEWTEQEIQMKLGLAVTRNELTNGDLFWPVRVALSGQERSASPVELALALGKVEVISRVKKAIGKLVS